MNPEKLLQLRKWTHGHGRQSVVVETVNGDLYFNCRNYVVPERRAYAWSFDGGDRFTEFGYDDESDRTYL